MDSKERVKVWRAEKAKQGWANYNIWFDPKTRKLLDELRRHFGRSKRGKNKPIIVKAIQHLHDFIFNE